jgi:hypothetical protein
MSRSALRSAVRLAVPLVAWSVSLLAAPRAAAQTQDAPPPYLQIFREEVKTGRGGPHVAAEAGWPRAFAKAGTKNYYLAMTTVYGPAEAWFLEGHASVAEIEESNTAIESAAGLGAQLDRLAQADAANISAARGILTRYQPELSNGAVDLSVMKVWEVIVFRVRPGHEPDFMEAAKLYKRTVEQGKIDLPWATYAVMAGMPSPTFLVFLPHRTLAEIDPATGAGAALEKAFDPESMKKLNDLSAGYESIEEMVFAVSPQMSYMSAEFVARDPKFWARKPAVATKRPAKPAQ